MTAALLPITYQAPPVAPAPYGLFSAVDWVQDSGPSRFLAGGVDVWPTNYGFETEFGVWGEDWCVDPDDIVDEKTGERPDIDALSPFEPMTVWAYDRNLCGDLSAESRSDVEARAIHTLLLLEQEAVETSFAARMLVDAPTAIAATGIVAGVSAIEVEFAKAGTTGYVHASPKWAAYAAQARLLDNGKTPMGHTWVFGGGYVTGLGNSLVATSQPFGWRGPAGTREAIKQEWNQYVYIAERSVVIGYEKALAEVAVT